MKRDEDERKQDAEPKSGGILKWDPNKTRKTSGSSVEFRMMDWLGEELNEECEPPSPVPSVDRLSVTWADIENIERSIEDTLKSLEFTPGSPPPVAKMEVRFPSETKDAKFDNDGDYSASISAIMLRRASTKRRGSRARRSSSPYSLDPFNPETKRRSSVYTNSSGETVISIEDSHVEVTQEQIYENIRLHKEVLRSVKQQPLEMKRKRRLVNQAKSYIKKHKGVLQDGLAKSGCGREIFARFHLFIASIIQQSKRELANISNWFIPWELRIKEIESHFGSVVASYFTFLRWLFWVNVVIAIVLVVFIVVPETLIAKDDIDGRKTMDDSEKNNSTDIFTLWEFQGVLKYSVIFYGFYSNAKNEIYNLPLAYFMTGLAVYIYSFVATLRKMAENSRMSKLSEKDDECIFSWKLFTAWDYMIGNTETAHNRTSSIILGFKEALLEEAEKKKDLRNWKVIFQRIIVNICIILLLGASAYAVVMVVQRSKEITNANWWQHNEITIVMSLISYIFPILFELLGLFENYHPRRQLRIQLARIMVLNLLNLYSLIIALFDKITGMTEELQNIKRNLSMAIEEPLSKLYPNLIENYTECFNIPVKCISSTSSLNGKSMLAAVMTTTAIANTVNVTYDSASMSTFQYSTEYPTTDYFTLSYSTDESTNMLTDRTDMFNTTNDYQNATDMFSNFTMYNNSTTSMYDEDIDYTSYSDYENLYSSTSVFYDDKSSNLTNASNNTNSTNEIYEKVNLRRRRHKSNESEQKDMCYKHFCCYSLLKNLIKNGTRIPEISPEIPDLKNREIDPKIRSKLKTLCWETMFGQELVKLTVMDLCLTILATLFMDFFRAVFIKHMNSCWCWDLEKKFPQYGDFKIAENILHLVNNQGMVWMGMFFSPGLVVLNLIKLIILMYLRSWAVMTCNVPHEVVFRASRSNNFYLALLLTMLFLCVLPVGYAIVWVEPSWHCGPFSDRKRMYHFFTESLFDSVSQSLHMPLNYMASPGIVIPLLVLLILIIYYLVSLTSALREANTDLKIQLRRERTEERRKMFQLANKRRGNSNDSETTPFSKWKKIVPMLPKAESNKPPQIGQSTEEEKKEFLAKIIRLGFRKSSGFSYDGSVAAPNADEETDTEFHESLPEDVLNKKDVNISQKLKNVIKSTKDTLMKKKLKLTDSDEKPSEEDDAKGRRESIANFAEKAMENERRKEAARINGSDNNGRKLQRTKFTKPSQSKEEKDEQKVGHTSRRSSEETRNDSITSIIPVITISKTESEENILEKDDKRENYM